MITREEYNKALDIIELYHKQLFSLNLTNKTKIVEWDKFNICSNRLKNILIGRFLTMSEEKYKFKYIEDINHDNFIKLRNAGDKAWKEFIKLRGY